MQVLLEKDKLTAGTTWHSAGLVWRLRPSDTDIELLNYTRELVRIWDLGYIHTTKLFNFIVQGGDVVLLFAFKVIEGARSE